MSEVTTTFAVLDVTKDDGQVAVAHEPKVLTDARLLVDVVPPMMTPPVDVVVEFEAIRIWPLAESKLVLLRFTSPKPLAAAPAVRAARQCSTATAR